MRYPIQFRDRILVKGSAFSSFVKNISKNIFKNISSNLSDKQSQKPLVNAKKFVSDARKAALKRAI